MKRHLVTGQGKAEYVSDGDGMQCDFMQETTEMMSPSAKGKTMSNSDAVELRLEMVPLKHSYWQKKIEAKYSISEIEASSSNVI
jgi:hypothetical protein